MKEDLKLVEEWDKVFEKSDKVDHKKVTFKNHFGITLAADMYIPKDKKERFSAIAVAGPFGAVKEQSSGLYAQELAERGFLTIAFDPSFTGESGGHPRYMNSPDINTEDFSAAVDYLSNLDNVDKEKIFADIINTISVKKPDAMAEEIMRKSLKYNGGKPSDDMTVLVLGLFDTYDK